jgi:hypothetical protein
MILLSPKGISASTLNFDSHSLDWSDIEVTKNIFFSAALPRRRVVFYLKWAKAYATRLWPNLWPSQAI